MEDINVVLGKDSAGTLIPTKTSQLINDSGYVVDPNYVHTDQNFTTYLQQTLVSKNCQIALNWLLGEEPDVLDTMKKALDTFENDPDKQDKPEQAVAGNIAVFDENKNTIDSGIAAANIVTHISLGLSTDITFDNLETKRQEGYIKANILYSYSTEDNYTGTLTYDSLTGSYCLVCMNGQDVKIRGIYAELDTDWVGIQKQLVFDETPKQDSSNPVTSRGINDAIQQSITQETERAKQAEQLLTDTTLKNTGNQTLTGSLTINGDLTVSGTTTTTETESLVVHDNLIVTNSEGAPLSDLSGLAIRTDETGVYGIVYDPTSESVKLGKGALSEHNELSFLQDEGSAIAVREDSSAFVDGHLIQWDAQKTRLVDGGEKPVIPTTLPNPKTLTAGSKVYDGAQDIVLEAADFDAITAVSFAGTNLTKQGTSASITQEQARTALALGSAAYTESTAYATSAQGTKIDSIAQKQVVTGNSTQTLETATEPLATQSYVQSVVQQGGVQSVSLESGTNNGTLKLVVDDVAQDNIAVTGLGSAAYTESSAYATAQQGLLAENAVPNTRTINSKSLAQNIVLTPEDIGAATSAQGALAESAYQKPQSGIPLEDLSTSVQSDLLDVVYYTDDWSTVNSKFNNNIKVFVDEDGSNWSVYNKVKDTTEGSAGEGTLDRIIFYCSRAGVVSDNKNSINYAVFTRLQNASDWTTSNESYTFVSDTAAEVNAYNIASTKYVSDMLEDIQQGGGIQSVSLQTGTNNGTLKLIVDGTETDNISVAGLQSAAYTSSSDYATAAQGQTVDSISQKTVVTSTQESVTLTQVAESLVSKSYADAEQTRATNAEAALSESIAQKAPIAHASAQTTYGAGTADLYGHVKLSDSTTSTSAAQNGTAATPVAVKTVNDALTSEISRAQAAEQTLSTDLQAEVTRATQAEAAHTAAITTLNDKQVVLASGSTEDLSATEQIIATKEYVDASSSGGESQINSHIANKSNPHEVTAQQIGLGNVANVLQYSDDNPPPYPVTSVAGRTGAVTLTKTDVGLGNVQNVDQTNASNITSGSLAINRIAEGLITSPSLSLLGTDIEVTRTEDGVYEIEAGDGLLRTYGTQSLKGSLTIVKEGHTSTGNLVVQGDLTVQGTTTTTEAESLVIHDNLIVTNSEGAELTNLSGIAIKVDGTNTYGIVYDPVSQSVKLGEGTLSENNELTFNSNEGSAVATRSDSIALTDGNLLQWDGTRNIIVDGGAKPTALPNPHALTLGSKVYNGSSDVTLLASDINAEPAFEKNTAFNKNFGTTADTVAQGNDSRITGAVQSAAFAGAAFTKTGTTLEITQTAARTALGLGSAAYTNSDIYATAVDLQTTNSNVTNASGKATPQSITQTSGNTSSTQGHTHSMTLTKEWFANNMNADSADAMVLYGGKADGTW